MKNLIVAFFFSTLIGSATGYASEQTQSRSLPAAAQLNFELRKSESHCDVQHVKVFFRVDEYGQVKVSKIDTQNLKLKNYILNKLAKLNFKGMNVEGEYNVTLSFDLGDKCT